jgi:hypothetical protein
MNEQFKSVITRALKRINQGEIQFGLVGISDKELTPEPRFFRTEKNGIGCYQKEYLGFYVLRAAYRGILLSINFLVAGDNNLSKKLLGPSVTNYYTSAYHILGAFLALKGRIIFERQIIWDDKTLAPENQFAVASFTKGKWNLQKKKWGHAGKWQEIKQLRLTEYPNSFIHLFKYWFKFRVKENISMTEYVAGLVKGEKIGTPLDINDIPDEFLNRITTSRHASIYESFGSEPEVMANIVNGDAFSDNGIDYQAKAYQQFCYEFLRENVNDLLNIIGEINVSKETKMYLRLAIFQPWFDDQQIDLVDDVELRNNITKAKSWIFQEE